MRLATRWGLLLLVNALPLIALLGAGLFALWQNGLLLPWLGISALISFVGWLVSRRLQRQPMELKGLEVLPAAVWPQPGADAWQDVEALSQRLQHEEPDLGAANFFWDTLKEVMEAVAVHFHPEEKDAILEMRVPDLLRVIELLGRDLRVAFTENVPGSHILTINDVVRGYRLTNQAKALYRLYRIVSAGIDPISALVRELRGQITEHFLAESTQEVKQWLIEAYVKKIGYYAIELYSGRLSADAELLRRHTSRISKRDSETVRKRETALAEEPFRLLVVGQVKAGKSSLVNGLLGEFKALVDVLPQTKGVQPYLLKREGIEKAIILDTVGYVDSAGAARPTADVLEAVHQADLILMVCSAKNAARQGDKKLLQALQAACRDRTGRELPPMLVVLTHIDRLRPFKEWDPPYNIENPERPKARAIRDAIDAVASDLGVEIDAVVPVSLKTHAEYNIEEGLLPAILQTLDSAKRIKYLRCLAEHESEEYWHRLWLQSLNAGRIIARKGFQWLQAAGGRFDRAAK